MADLIKRLSEGFGVSGAEDDVRRLIIGEIKDKTDGITVDTMGSLSKKAKRAAKR